MGGVVHSEPALLFALLRRGLGEPADLPTAVEPERLEALWRFAEKQDVAHLVALALQQVPLLPADHPLTDEITRCPIVTLYRSEMQQEALRQAGEALAAAGIPYLPLKGAVLREWYPQPWLRTGCDIDLLIHPEDLEAACLALEGIRCRRGRQGGHDVSFFTESQVHIELHYRLMGETQTDAAADLLSRVWEHSHPVAEGSLRYGMEDGFFYLYHIAHMAKHCRSGGCGVRFFLDLRMLEKKPHDRMERDTLLKEGGLLPFADACRRLTAWWFDGTQPDETCRDLQRYVLRGGVYGSATQKAAARQSRQGGKAGYVWHRLFPSRRLLQWDFPVLRRCPWLLPGCWLWRLLRLPFGGRLRRSVYSLTTTGDEVTATAELLRRLGL